MSTQTLARALPVVRTRTLSLQNYAPWLRALLFLVLIAAPAGVIIHLIATYAVDIPFWDQWYTARLFGVTRYHHESLLDLARQQNESRLLFPNLVFLALSLPTGTWSVVREMYFSVALVATVSAILFQLLRRTGFSLPVQAGLLFLINWLLFSPTQQENWFFGIQICYYLPPTALCLALLANVSHRSLAWKTVVGLALSFVAAYSFSGGVLICALAFPGFLPANWSAAGGWLPSRREWVWHAVYVVVSALMLTAYFWDYQEPAGAGSLLYMFTHLKASSSYFFAWFGSPLLPRGPLPQSIGVGVFIFLLLAGLLAAAWRGLVNRQEQDRLYPWVVLAGYAVGTGLATVLGRSGFGTTQALSSRYVTFSSYAYVVILVLAAYLWCFYRQRLTPWARHAGLTAGLIVAAVLGTIFIGAQWFTIPAIKDGAEFRKFGRAGLVFLPLMPTGQNLNALCGVPEFVQKRALDLLRRHILNVPQISATALRERINHVDERGEAAYGALDEPTLEEAGRVAIHGWAVDPMKKQPGGVVLITCTGQDRVTRPLVVFNTFTYRPDEAPADGIYQAMPCGFNGHANLDQLAPGQYLMAAWRVDAKLSTANELADTYTVNWARSGKLKRALDTIIFPPLNTDDNSRNGFVDGVTLQPGNRLNANGWAVNADSGTVPKAVLITCTDTTGATRIVGTTGPNGPRLDVAGALHTDALAYSGFNVTLDVGKLPPGSYQVAAWGIGNNEENIAQLGKTYPIRIAPK